MKISGIDISAKYIECEVEGKKQLIQFRENPSKGIHDVQIFVDGRLVESKIKQTYPPLTQIIEELWQICLGKIIKKFRQ